MSTQVPATFQSRYRNNVETVLQQNKSMLLDAVMVTDEAGGDKIKITDLVGNADPQEATERHGDTKYANTPHDGVWLPKKPELYFADLVDNEDRLSTVIDLEGAYTREGANVVARSRDRRILEGIYAPIISGVAGTTSTPFPSGNIIPVTTGGASGAQRMNVAKLRAANKLLANNYVDLNEQKYIVLTSEQADDLLSEVPATSSDFASAFGGQVNDQGFITRLLGWNIIIMELDNPKLGPIASTGYSLDSSGYRKNPFWVKSGVAANFWQRLRTSIDPVPTKVLSRQVFAGTTLAATRTQAGKVGIILNSEA